MQLPPTDNKCSFVADIGRFEDVEAAHCCADDHARYLRVPVSLLEISLHNSTILAQAHVRALGSSGHRIAVHPATQRLWALQETNQ